MRLSIYSIQKLKYKGGSLYNLSQTIMKNLDLKPSGKPLRELNTGGKGLSVVVLDGFGYNIAVRSGSIEDDGDHLTSVFPSITTTVLTTLMSGQLPGEHGILGESVYLKKFGSIVNLFSYSPIYSEEKDSLKAIEPMKSTFETFDIISNATQNGKRCAVITPNSSANTELSSVTTGESGDRFYFRSIWDALEIYRSVLKQNYDYVYLYIPFIDKMAHIYGPFGDPTLRAATDISKSVREIANENSSRYVTVITADHGHIEAGQGVLLSDSEEFERTTSMPPFGSSRSLFLSGHHELIEVLTTETPDLKIFDNSDPHIRMLLGSTDVFKKTTFNYIAVPEGNQFYFHQKTAFYYATIDFKGRHGGLSKDEMLVPYIKVGE